MTYREMADHMVRHKPLVAENKVTVGKYAKSLGFRTYKPMIRGRVCFFYVNEYIEIDGDANR